MSSVDKHLNELRTTKEKVINSLDARSTWKLHKSIFNGSQENISIIESQRYPQHIL